MKILKILSINILLTFILFSFTEIFFRTLKGIKNNTFPNSLMPLAKDRSFGMYSFNNLLGYSPTPKFSKLINNRLKHWNNVQVTILDDSTRLSSPEGLYERKNFNEKLKNILTVGDSFTFGDQVSDKDTWQSCLNNKKSRYFFINGGVGGYGILQSILRAEELSRNNKKNISGIILSVLVGSDAGRDKLDFRSGFPKPSLFKTKTGEIVIKHLPEDAITVIGGKYTKSQSNNFLDFFISNISFLRKVPIKYVQDFYQKFHNRNVNRFTRFNESPPSINEIYNWNAKKSKKLNRNVIWLLQYPALMNDKKIAERKYIIDLLKREKINFIDTYIPLHGEKVIYASSDLWDSHHTPLGNKVVCNTIHNYFNSMEYNF